MTADDKVTRVDRAQRIGWLEAVAATATEQAELVRAELDAEARDEHTAGSTPSWRIRDIGTVSARETRDKVRVDDPAKLLAWVAERHPENVQQIVRPAYVDALVKGCKPSGIAPGEVVDGAGEVVPGLEWTAGGDYMGIAFRLDDTAHQVFKLAAGLALDAAMRGPGSPFAAELAQAAEAAGLPAGERAGTDEAS